MPRRRGAAIRSGADQGVWHLPRRQRLWSDVVASVRVRLDSGVAERAQVLSQFICAGHGAALHLPKDGLNW
jgi:hypothetical protein